MGDELLTTREAADLLGVSNRTLFRIAKDVRVYSGRAGGEGQPSMYSRNGIEALKAERAADLCAACGRRPSRAGRHRTCGSPPCVREYRLIKARNDRELRKQRAQEQPRRLTSQPPAGTFSVLSAWREHANLEQRDRYIATAVDTGVSVATVISVVRAFTKES